MLVVRGSVTEALLRQVQLPVPASRWVLIEVVRFRLPVRTRRLLLWSTLIDGTSAVIPPSAFENLFGVPPQRTMLIVLFDRVVSIPLEKVPALCLYRIMWLSVLSIADA